MNKIEEPLPEPERKPLPICPRCKVRTLNPDMVMNSLSRYHKDTYICPQCGQEEAMDDFYGKKPLEW